MSPRSAFAVYEFTDYAYHSDVFLDSPRGLRSSERLAERTAMLAEPRVQPLQKWAAQLANDRAERFGEPVLIPHFDPAEAGIDARVLVLLEAPGPMTNAGNARPGSGFVSVDNDDVTAETCWRLRSEVGLDEGAFQWNIVPWYLGAASRKPSAHELADGGAALLAMLSLLPKLEAVIACGRYAQRGWARYVAPSVGNLTLVNTWHPSPLAMKQPGKRDELRAALSTVVRALRS